MKGYVFIFGAGRTGTTLATRIIEKSPKVYIYKQESHAYLVFWKFGNKLQIPTNVKNYEDFADYVLQKFPEINFGWKQENEYIKLEDLVAEIRKQAFFPKNTADFLNFLIRQEQSPEIEYFGEKTPAHIYYYNEILNHFNPAKIIITIRDPRATAYSELIKKNIKALGLAPFNLLTFIARYNTAYYLVDKIKKKIGSDNVLVVKYEDMVVQPEITIQNMCNFLGIEFQADMLQMGVFNSSFGDKFQKDKNFNTENIDRWKDEMDKSMISTIEINCNEIMQQYNYEKSNLGDGSDLNFTSKLKLFVAKYFVRTAPSLFHYINKNKKYRI
ncbi:MAG: sulfotransferase [Sphingobacteriales bacterium]|jgi:hypothetical protein|nr:MAG: sulfotransferase [Sphingobacteriales bacterium]